MIRGRVVGKVWSSRRIDSFPSGGALLEVKTESGDHLIAFDPLGCDIDEKVIVTQGSVAAAFFKKSTPSPVDALIIGSIDDQL